MAIVAEIEQAEVTTLSWGAVIAGAVASAALTLLLLALGVGLGLSVVSPWSDQGVSAYDLQRRSGPLPYRGRDVVLDRRRVPRRAPSGALDWRPRFEVLLP